MIRKLKFQIGLTISLILSLLLILLLFTVNVLNHTRSLNDAYRTLAVVAAANGEKVLSVDGSISENDSESEEQAVYRSSRFFSVFFDNKGKVVVVKNHEESGCSDEQLRELALEVYSSGEARGRRGNLLFTIGDYIGGRIVVFMDNTITLRNIKTMQNNSILIGCLGIAVIIWLAYALAEWIVLPVKESFDRQKRFISDASHELKTPIAVISANLDVLEDDVGGDNKWIRYIKSETERMTGLVSHLLMLSKVDLTDERPAFVRFNMSKIVEGVTMPFECVAFEKGAILECDPGEDIFLTGSEESIKQVIAILTDNAIKHVYKDGKILVSLRQHRGKAILEVANTGDPIPKEERSRIFERFYRADDSRSREESRFGLGLAIAKTIVNMHSGSISVDCADGWTRFKVVI